MSPASYSSALHDRVGHAIIGPPNGPLQHAYLIPGDRIALDPPQPDNVDWLHDKLAVLSLSYGALRRLGPLNFIGLVVVMIVGMAVLGAIGGVKAGAHKVESVFSSSSSTTTLTPDQQAQKARCQAIAAQGGYVAPACQALIQEQ